MFLIKSVHHDRNAASDSPLLVTFGHMLLTNIAHSIFSDTTKQLPPTHILVSSMSSSSSSGSPNLWEDLASALHNLSKPQPVSAHQTHLSSSSSSSSSSDPFASLHTNPVWAQIHQYRNSSLPPSTQLTPGQLLLAFQGLSTSNKPNSAPPCSSNSASCENDVPPTATFTSDDSQSSYAPPLPPIPFQLDHQEEGPSDNDQLVHGYNADYDFGEVHCLQYCD